MVMAGAYSHRSYSNYSGGRIDLSGNGFIAGIAPGIVTVGGAPASRRIEVIDIQTRRTVASTVSAADGTFRINNLNPSRRYRVLAYDHQLVYNAVIRDNITPAVDE